jgi:hypothetical protein
MDEYEAVERQKESREESWSGCKNENEDDEKGISEYDETLLLPIFFLL